MRREEKSIEARIAALADGTLGDDALADSTLGDDAVAAGALAPEQRERMLALLEDSPELSRALARQRQALAAVGSLQDVKAPPQLHAAVESLVAEHASRRRGGAHGLHRLTSRLFASWLPSRSPATRQRALRPLAASAALAALVAALVLALAGQPAGSPTVAQAARLALRPATLPSPSENARHSHALNIAVEGLAYPYWQGSLGWRATGSRRDRLGGRTVTTVFYERGGAPARGAQVGYAIVSGRSLPSPGGAVVVHRGISFRVLAAGGATVVTWRRDGHTCILVARHVAAARLMDLASWE